MSAGSITDDSRLGGPARATALPVDSLALGMAFLVGLTVAQRIVGLARNVLFCRLLDEDQLGLWSLGLSFLVLAAPLAVLGIPGTFGRYLEHYRQRGQLRQFLWRTTWATLVLAICATALVCLARNWLSLLIFNEPQETSLVLGLGVGLAAAIGFNFLTELLSALRQVRAVSVMQFINSIAFTLVGLGLLFTTSWGAVGLTLAYAVSCVIPCLWVWRRLSQIKFDESAATPPLSNSDLWGKLAPFAAWMWLINLLANLCDVTDRYLVLHWSNLDPHQALGLVGQLHASRVIPVLMIGVAMMIGGAILPYLSHDWEAGKRAVVSTRMNLAIKLLGLAFTGGSALILVLTPPLFGWVLQGRYDDGLAVLPLSLLYCVWFSLALLAQNYLLCAEKSKLGGLAFAVCLACNVGLNMLLLPLFGLQGAATATACANGVLLIVMLGLSLRQGLTFDLGTWLVALSPLLLLLGAWPAAICVLLVGWLALGGTWFFDDAEKQQLRELSRRMLRRQRQVV